MLIVLEMANNHMGDVELGERIITECWEVTRDFPQFDYGIKFQFRDIEGGTYIHPDADPEDKYVKRFKETNLSRNDRAYLWGYAKGLGFKTICTPFDEKSVDDVVSHGYDILKVGSPSFTEMRLWDKIISVWEGPIIASVGGATERDIEKVVKLMGEECLTLLHCVSEYPTKPENLQLNQIDWLKKKYPNLKVGFSSHQNPKEDMYWHPHIDVCEVHVCVEPAPNNYSITPDVLKDMLAAFVQDEAVCGVKNTRVPGPKPTQFMRREIDGKMWWCPEKQFTAKSFNLWMDDGYVKDIMALIDKSGVVIPKGSKMILSHHYGIDDFRNWGAAVIECFNTDGYAKKILVMLPHQKHLEHYHVKKDETFSVLYGTLLLRVYAGLDRYQHVLNPGMHRRVSPGVPHGFQSLGGGCVFEEISTHQHEGDSVYLEEVSKNRKTFVREF